MFAVRNHPEQTSMVHIYKSANRQLILYCYHIWSNALAMYLDILDINPGTFRNGIDLDMAS